MEKSIKRKIAKEIIIFFSSVLIIGLAWVIFWAINQANLNKAESLQKQIASLDHNIDSIKISFPKSKAFDELFLGNVPENFYEPLDSKLPKLPKGYTLIRTLRKYDPLEILGFDFENTTKADNIRKLYQLLSNSHYELPTFPDFQKIIVQEIEGDTLNLDSISTTKPQLKKIYTFLSNKKYLTISIDEFVLAFDELPLPPPHSIWTTYQNSKSKKEGLESELNLTKSKIYSSNRLTEIAKWISIIVLLIVYPFRALIFLLIWSFKTLRQG